MDDRPNKVVFTGADDTGAFWVSDAVLNVIKQAIATGDGWPEHAVYRSEHRYHTWPSGWDVMTFVKYHDNKQALETFLEEKRTWALSDDNEVKIEVYAWDQGPQYKSQHHFS